MSDKINTLVNLAIAVVEQNNASEYWDSVMDFVFAEFAEPDPDSAKQLRPYFVSNIMSDELSRAAEKIDERLLPILVTWFMFRSDNFPYVDPNSRMMEKFHERYGPIVHDLLRVKHSPKAN